MLRITLDNGKEYFSSGTIDGMNDAISHSLDYASPLVGFVQNDGKKAMVKINMIEEITEVDDKEALSMNELSYLRACAQSKLEKTFPSALPNISISFGESKEANIDEIAGKIRTILEEELARSTNNCY